MPTSRTPHARGFTLIELLVVIAIIAVLAGLIIPASQNMRVRGQITLTENLVNSLHTAEEAYKLEHAEYLVHWNSGDHYIDDDRDDHRFFDNQGRLVGTSSGDHQPDQQTMAEVLMSYGANIDREYVINNRVQDPWEQDIVLGVLEHGGSIAWAGGLSESEWFVRGFKPGDLLIFSMGLTGLTGNTDARIFHAANDTGMRDDDADNIGDYPYWKIKSGAQRAFEPGVKRWSHITR